MLALTWYAKDKENKGHDKAFVLPKWLPMVLSTKLRAFGQTFTVV
jgi:hypothetical protein